MGPVTSAKLAKDFDDWHERALRFTCGEDTAWFQARYLDWSMAFHLAARGGAVKFH